MSTYIEDSLGVRTGIGSNANDLCAREVVAVMTLRARKERRRALRGIPPLLKALDVNMLFRSI